MRRSTTNGHVFLLFATMLASPPAARAQESREPATKLEVLWQFQTGG
jgi:hypothetical protein